MENLLRTMSANLRLENAVELEKLNEGNALDYIIDANEVIDIPAYVLRMQEFEKIKKGQYIFDDKISDGVIKLIFEDNLVAIGLKEDNKIKPKTVVI